MGVNIGARCVSDMDDRHLYMRGRRQRDSLVLSWSGVCEGALDFAVRTERLTYRELWEWCRKAPFTTAMNGRGHLRLIHRRHQGEPNPRPSTAENDEALMYPLMVAHAVSVALGGRDPCLAEWAEGIPWA